jgi:hypothetical protein
MATQPAVPTDQALRIAKRKLGSSPHVLPKAPRSQNQILSHEFNCPRYGQSGDIQIKKCICDRHISRQQAEHAVDEGFAKWLESSRSGHVYKSHTVKSAGTA